MPGARTIRKGFWSVLWVGAGECCAEVVQKRRSWKADLSWVFALHPKTTRNTPAVKYIGSITHRSKREWTAYGTAGYLSKRVLERISEGFGL